jgi:hypothetical protein
LGYGRGYVKNLELIMSQDPFDECITILKIFMKIVIFDGNVPGPKANG